jgi:hypothetical protein
VIHGKIGRERGNVDARAHISHIRGLLHASRDLKHSGARVRASVCRSKRRAATLFCTANCCSDFSNALGYDVDAFAGGGKLVLLSDAGQEVGQILLQLIPLPLPVLDIRQASLPVLTAFTPTP